jgi:hypothetical protein
VISEVRRAKTAVAQKYGFDVIAMLRGLRQIDEEENENKMVDSTPTHLTPTLSLRSRQESRPGQP